MQNDSILASDERVATTRRYALHLIQTTCALAAGIAIFAAEPVSRIAAAVALAAAMLVIGFSILYGRLAVTELSVHKTLVGVTQEARQQVEELFAMTDMLQAAEDHDDAGAVLMATAQRLLPGFGGALYVFNNSRDRLDLATSWNVTEGFCVSEVLLPGNCWALKRGKTHFNDRSQQTLCCMHPVGTAAAIEVPMMARGQVYGLLVLALEGDDASKRLEEVSRVARALADSMSLALSNIALREKLRTQSLRDPLTGLYNRRYMEDALERYISLAERSGAATSVLMIDLDNFKRLNDEYGHAKGDAVLRDVAGQLVGALRPSDVVARYGGEELMVILPDCGVEDAAVKAEALRMRVESLSEVHGVPISASFGVATIPQTSTSAADLVPMADAALYEAKQNGKNRVVCADKRSGREDKPSPRLTVTG